MVETRHDIINVVAEYGSEIGNWIPYIHYLKKNNLLNGKKIITYKGMEPYYYFLDPEEIEYKTESRRFCPYSPQLPKHIGLLDTFFVNDDTSMFSPPDYYNHYKDYSIDHIIKTEKPLIIINNKFNSEWHPTPANYFSIEELRDILKILTPHFTIVYILVDNFKMKDYSCDEAEVLKPFQLNEKAMIEKEFPDVYIVEKILENEGISLNQFKCMVMPKAYATISIISGSNYFNSYFPIKHLIHFKYCPIDFYNADYYQKLHNSLCSNPTNIMYSTSYEDMMSHIRSLVPSA